MIIRNVFRCTRVSLVVGVLLCFVPNLAVCDDNITRTESVEMQKKRAMAVAGAWLARHVSKDAEILKYDVVIVDGGRFWGVSFMPPGKNITGGVPEFYIDKRTYRILKVGIGQ